MECNRQWYDKYCSLLCYPTSCPPRKIVKYSQPKPDCVVGDGTLPIGFRHSRCRPDLHLKSFLLQIGDVEVKSDLICSGCDKTIRVDFILIVCSTRQGNYHRICSGLTPAHNTCLRFTCASCSGGFIALLASTVAGI